MLANPYLLRREAYFVRHDPVLKLSASGGFTQIEADLTDRLGREAREAIAMVEKEFGVPAP